MAIISKCENKQKCYCVYIYIYVQKPTHRALLHRCYCYIHDNIIVLSFFFSRSTTIEFPFILFYIFRFVLLNSFDVTNKL